jgi:ribonuclease-3
MCTSDSEGETSLQRTAERIGHEFQDDSLLRQALTHASVPRTDNACASERLEFLGDAAVALAIAELLFERHPEWSEGKLSLARAACVKAETLASKAKELGLDAALRLGRGEQKTGGRSKGSILAAAYESVIGAVFLDAGYACVRALVQAHFAAELGATTAHNTDYKTRLQERVQAALGTTPHYRVVGSSGPDHDRRFVVAVEIGGRLVAQGVGSSKRAAEQQAAHAALAQPLGDETSGQNRPKS